ncbi:hypothetical protein SLE2022_372220 [Rubroshorea leprosula]
MVGLKFAVSLSSSIVTVVLVVLVIALTVQTEVSKAQSTCSTSLGNLNQCAPSVAPGDPNTTPSGDCCDAFAAVSYDCICTTLSIVAYLPSLSNLPPVNCPNLPNLM